MVKAIRENIHYGATVIKIVVDDQQYIYTADDIAFMKDEVERAGLKLAAHAWTEQGAINAARAGVHSIEHGASMSDSALRLAKEHDVVLVGTEYLGLRSPDAVRARWVDRLRRAHAIGVKLVYGTDAITAIDSLTRGEDAILGIDPWVEAGIPAADILRAMTSDATRLLGVGRERGTLKVGMWADLIATPDNPLDNIETLKEVSLVMKNGVVVSRP
jgi:imidazolonepropionase-like amidohydrolase